MKLLLLTVLSLFLYIALYHTYPPPIENNPVTTEFSSKNALQHIQRIAEKPHPTGSLAHDEVFSYLKKQIEGLGLSPEIQLTNIVNPNNHTSQQIKNILVRIPGLNSSKSILLSAHYDSVSTGPGAADDGASVAAILETMRCLKSQPALQNDVIAIFSDAEEMGLLGAKAFVEQHPWAKEIGVVLNFEYRGNSGAFMMFETSMGNSFLIEGLAKVPFVLANSLMFEVYKRLPNDTDFSIYKRAGYSGMNFAAIEGLASYHTQLDRPELLNIRTLQHEGNLILALSKYFGNSPISEKSYEDSIYFDLPGWGLIHYSVAWILPLNGLLIILFGYVTLQKNLLEALSFPKIVIGILIFILIIIVQTVITYALGCCIQILLANISNINKADVNTNYLILFGFTLFNGMLFCFLQNICFKHLKPTETYLSILFVVLLITLITGFTMPGASFVFFWPLLFCLVAKVRGESLRIYKNYNSPLLIIMGSIPAILILIPLIKLIYVALTLQLIAVIVPIVILFLGMELPLILYFTSSKNNSLNSSMG